VKKLAIAGLALILSAAFAGMAFAADATVTGHLRDSFCYSTMGAHGPGHKQCAIACASKGIPVGLVQDGTNKMFILLPPKDKESLPESVISRMEDHVTVTGTEYTKNGVTFLRVESVK
jgi:hypothetical protein